MNNVIRWDPFRSSPLRELENIGDRFGRFFDRLSNSRGNGGEAMTVADWIPTVDVAEDDREYLIKVEIPEVDKKDVKVTVQEGMLTIQGERKKEKEERGKRFHRMERSYGTFVRSFMLPEDAAEEKISAEFKDGMLFVHMPKTEKPKPKQVEVKVA
ncbi:MAG TPA: Hsp20/alpha crystallin family protein [Terriglobia bacterium]|nr:Hsp20/alpha crystallin family protein [Terriglobia bacterium]